MSKARDWLDNFNKRPRWQNTIGAELYASVAENGDFVLKDKDEEGICFLSAGDALELAQWITDTFGG